MYINQRIFLVSVLCALILLLQSCDEQHSSYHWKILIYMDADNDLSESALADLGEIADGLSSENIAVFVQLDLPNGISTKRLQIKEHEQIILEDIGESNMASATTLADFIHWGHTQASTTHTLLILWDHGNGWDHQQLPANAKPAQRSLFVDEDNSADFLANRKVREAIETSNISIDILGFDASIMGTLEALYEFRELSPILITSQEVGEASGWNYTQLLQKLSVNSSMTPEELARQIVETYKNFYETVFYPGKPVNYDQRYGLSALQTDFLEAIALSANELAITWMDKLAIDSQSLNDLIAARQNSQNIDRYIQPFVYVDLADFASHLDSNSQIPELIDRAIIAEYHGKDRPHAKGISTVFFQLPESRSLNSCDSNYKNWNVSDETGNRGEFINEFSWDEFWQSYAAFFPGNNGNLCN